MRQPRETTSATAAVWAEEATDELLPAASDVFALPAAAERGLITALPEALAAHRMDLLAMR